jgi:hypothetical protein
MTAATEKCPWCGHLIAHDRFVEIQNAIRKEEKQKLAAAEQAMKLRLEKEISGRFAAEQLKLANERKQVDAERIKLAEDRRSMAANTKQQVELAKELAEKQRLREVTQIRAVLQKDKDDALVKRDADFAREREALQKKVLDMSRRIQRKTAGEVGDGAELDLFEELRTSFPDDAISRIANGKSGRHILHVIRYKGKPCGKILIDSTQRAAWQRSFVSKLRQDQTAVAADHALLSTTVFPAGKRELFIEGDIIIAAPARVPTIVEVLRKALIAMHVAKMSDAERADKVSQLFKFITSSAFKKKLSEAEQLTSDASEIDVEEQRVHGNVWKKRGLIVTRIKHVLREIDTEVSAIVESRDGGQLTDIELSPVRTVASRVH